MERKNHSEESVYQKAIEILTIFTDAVRKAQEENRRLGLPNVYAAGDEIFYQLPNGKITTRLSKKLI